jgi:hypothetical protein
MDFDDLIFPPGSEFIFGLWAYKTDDKGNLQGWLVEAQEDHREFILSMGSGVLTERLSKLTMSELTRAPTSTGFDSNSGLESSSETNSGSLQNRLSSEFFYGTPEHGIYHSKNQHWLVPRFYHEVESFPNGAQQHGRILSSFTSRRSQTSAKATTSRGSRGPHHDYNP